MKRAQEICHGRERVKALDFNSNSGVLNSKPLSGSKVNSLFYPSKVEKLLGT